MVMQVTITTGFYYFKVKTMGFIVGLYQSHTTSAEGVLEHVTQTGHLYNILVQVLATS